MTNPYRATLSFAHNPLLRWTPVSQAFWAADSAHRKALGPEGEPPADPATFDALDCAAFTAALHFSELPQVLEDKSRMAGSLFSISAYRHDPKLDRLAELLLASMGKMSQTDIPGENFSSDHPSEQSALPLVIAEWMPAVNFWRAYNAAHQGSLEGGYSRRLSDAFGQVSTSSPATLSGLADKARVFCLLAALEILSSTFDSPTAEREAEAERVQGWIRQVMTLREEAFLAALADCRSAARVRADVAAAALKGRIAPVTLVRLCLDTLDATLIDALRRDCRGLWVHPT